MSRDKFEIPEVFRKAMEDAGWDLGNKDDEGNEGGSGNGGNGGNGGNRQPFPRRPQQPNRPNRIIWLLGLFFLLLLSLNWIVTTYTEWLWFTELTYEKVWLKQWGVEVISFVISFALAAIIILLNWHLARRRAIKITPSFYPQFLQFSGFTWLINGAALFFAFVFGSAAASQWENLLLFLNQVPFGANDPIFGQDISFYLFTLPIYQFLQGWLSSLLLITILGTSFIYVINYLPDVQRGRWQTVTTSTMREHIALLGVLFLGLWAAGNALNIYNLLYSDRGVVFGASYTDMNASLYGLWAQAILMGLTAVAVGINIFRQNLRLPLITAALWLVASFVMGGIYPNLLQRYAVEPNEIVRESPYIENNIKYTRLAFGLDKIETRVFEYGDEPTQEDLRANEVSFRNVRLWDYRPLQATYEQLQALRPYYEFSEIDIDRYTINDEERQVMLAARELNKTKLPNRTWVNENLEFTHGYGIVMNPVDQVTRDGQPEFYIKDLPPVSDIPVQIDQPEIYYGELTNDVVFVGSDREEFSYPSGDENVYSSYTGKGGVQLDSGLKRLAFALQLADTNVLLSDEITRDTRVQFHREISERVKQITPFLKLDGDPYIVAWNGRLIWVLDAYTVSDRFPYATPLSGLNIPFNGINYIRNAVKITVDAYDGTVTYYITAPEDPIIQAYNKAFPNLFHPLSVMSEELQAHLRYPVDLFDIQAHQYLTYHMQDVRVFYNQEDLRAIPNEILEGNQILMEPYYVILPLPGASEPEFLLIQPFTPANKPNMVSWIAARNDPPNYGQLIEYELPKQELVFGPIQVEGRIDQEPEISQQFSLWDQRGSSVIRGNLIVIPVNDSFLYVEPVYLQSDTSALPELKRVIVATNSRIAMRETLDDALLAIIQGAPAVATIETGSEADAPSTDTGNTQPVTTPPISADISLEALIQSANAHFDAAEAAQRSGDWSTYGTELDALQQDLQQLMQMTSAEP